MTVIYTGATDRGVPRTALPRLLADVQSPHADAHHAPAATGYR